MNQEEAFVLMREIRDEVQPAAEAAQAALRRGMRKYGDPFPGDIPRDFRVASRNGRLWFVEFTFDLIGEDCETYSTTVEVRDREGWRDSYERNLALRIMHVA